MMTAIEFLVDKICIDVDMYDEEGNVNGVEYWNAFRSCTDLSEYINKAKEMEKQQIIDAYRDGRSDQQSDIPSKFYNRMAEDFYNETFKNTKE
jgi:uncharacterized protein YuzE